MANIKTHLDKIKNALFGQEVRGSIHDGIDAINKEVEGTTEKQNKLGEQFKNLVINEGNSNAEVAASRGSHDWLPDRLDNFDSQLEHIENKEMVSVTDYGAKGDGITDDTQSFINAINSSNLIYIPSGEYLINQKLDLNGKCLIGESMNNTSLDFKDCNDDYCISITGFRVELSNFKIYTNTDNSSQFAIKANYITDGSIIKNIVVMDNAPNGIYISRSWYFYLDNIRTRNTNFNGVCLHIESDSNGGVNGSIFKNLFLSGGKNTVKITSSAYMSEVLNFIGCTFENCYKTAIYCEGDKLTRVKFDTCYFENVYKNTDDNDVPVMLDNNTGENIIITNSMIRTSNINNRYLVKGNASLDNIYNANFMCITNDTNNSIIINNVKNAKIEGKEYLSNQNGCKLIETISCEEAEYLFKEKVIKKTISTVDTDTILFRFARSSNSTTALKIGIIFKGSNNYTHGYIEYKMLDIATGATPTTIFVPVMNHIQNKGNFTECISLRATSPKYDSSLDSMCIDIILNVNHSDCLGTYVISTEGFHNAMNFNSNRGVIKI